MEKYLVLLTFESNARLEYNMFTLKGGSYQNLTGSVTCLCIRDKIMTRSMIAFVDAYTRKDI